MATTSSDGSFEIIDVPAKKYNEFLIMFGTYSYFCKEKLTVIANEATVLEPFNFSSDEMILYGHDGKDGDKGEKGDKGDDGKDGSSIVWKGSYSSSDQLTNPQYLWAFFNTTDGCSYIYDGENWTLLTSKGDKGEAGADAD